MYAKEAYLQSAANSGDISMVSALIEAGADVQYNHNAALIHSCHQGYADIVSLLLKNGADPNARNAAPLMEACREKNVEIVRLLLDAGAFFNAHNYKALHLCVNDTLSGKSSEALQIAKLLVEAGRSREDIESLNGFFRHQSFSRHPASAYLYFVHEACNPKSALSIQRLFPELTSKDINLQAGRIQATPLFRYISHCAALAAIIEGGRTGDVFFISLLRHGIDRVIHRRACSFKELAASLAKDIDGFQNIPDVIRTFVDHVLVPISTDTVHSKTPMFNNESTLDNLRQILAPLGARILFLGRSPAEILRFNRKFHRADRGIPFETLPHYNDVKWLPLMAPVDLGGNYSISALTSHRELVREGQKMNTCLKYGSYSYDCSTGKRHILSLRLNGEPIAHAELVPSEDIGDFRVNDRLWMSVRQFRAAWNSEPDHSAKHRFNLFKEMIAKEVVAFASGPFGETLESRERRIERRLPRAELLSGIPLGEYPTGIVEHFKNRIFIERPQQSSASPPERLPLLRDVALKPIILATLIAHKRELVDMSDA